MGRKKKEIEVPQNNNNSIIKEELNRFEAKIKDFQNFIQEKPNDKTITIQVKLMKELPALLKQLAILRSQDLSKVEDVRGDVDLSLLETGEI